MTLQRLRFELRYLKGHTPWDHGEVPPELTEFMGSHSPGRAIEFGCGTGTNALALASQGWQVVAVDVSWLAIRQARVKARHAKQEIEFHRGNAAHADQIGLPEGPYDFGLDIGCFHALDSGDRRRYAAHLAGLLRPGATLLIYSFLQADPTQRGPWPDESEFKRCFEGPFQLDQVEHGWYGERRSAWFTFVRLD